MQQGWRDPGGFVRVDGDSRYTEARIYLANALYDRGETDAALYHLEKTQPEDHYDDLALWRAIELKKALYRLPDADPELTPWLVALADRLTPG